MRRQQIIDGRRIEGTVLRAALIVHLVRTGVHPVTAVLRELK